MANRDGRDFDVVIIGAGVVGSAIARYLSRYDCSVAVVEKGSDVGGGASSRNSGVIHAGINSKPGTLRARFCMEGRRLLIDWCDQMNVPYEICGKLVVARREEEIPGLERLKRDGEENGVPDLRIISGDEAARLQPGIRCVAALHVPSSGIVSPYALTIALAEDAAVNGVVFFLDNRVEGIEPGEECFVVRTDKGILRGRWLINSAGIHAGEIARLIDQEAPPLYPCVGEYLILDRLVGERISMSVYPAPRVDNAGLGVHITPTTEGNVLLGPSNEYVADPEESRSTRPTMKRLLKEVRVMWPDVPESLVIGAYAGVRAKLTPPDAGGFGDYIIRRTPAYPRAIQLIGIESPGLTAAPAIARYVIDDIVRTEEPFEPKPDRAIAIRRWPRRFDELPEEEKQRLVSEDPDYGEIVCRCEGVTKHEVLHALRNPLGVKTLAGIKFRSRVTMGRCNGGYCLPRIVDMLQKEGGWTSDSFVLRGPSSPLFVGRVVEGEDA